MPIFRRDPCQANLSRAGFQPQLARLLVVADIMNWRHAASRMRSSNRMFGGKATR